MPKKIMLKVAFANFMVGLTLTSLASAQNVSNNCSGSEFPTGPYQNFCKNCWIKTEPIHTPLGEPKFLMAQCKKDNGTWNNVSYSMAMAAVCKSKGYVLENKNGSLGCSGRIGPL